MKRVKNLYLILAVLLMIGVVPIIFIGSQLTAINSQTLEAKEKVYQVQTVRDKAQQIELYVQGYIAQVRSYAHAFEIGGDLRRAGSSNGQEQLVKTLKEDTNLIALILAPRDAPNDSSYVINQGKISSEEVTRALNEATQIVFDRQSWIGPPHIIRSSLEPALVIAQPVTRNGEVEGVVMAIVSLQKVFSLVAQDSNLDEKQLLRGEQTVFFVVDSEGLAVAHPDQKLAFKRQDMSYLKVVQDWLESNEKVAVTRSFTLRRDNEELPMLGSYATSQLAPGRRLGVIGVVNQKAAYLSVGLMRQRTLIVTLIAALVAVAAGIFFAHGFSAPIQSLATTARAIAGGDFTKRIEVSTASRELGQLAEDFNHMSGQLQTYINDLTQLASRNKSLFIGSVRSLAAAIDGKDPYTRGHSERVMIYSSVIAEGIGLPEDEVEKIRISALLHDVGKIGIEDRILRKPAALTDQEFTIMKSHPAKGAYIMSENPEMAEYLPGMHFHHETMDGKGYPLGLRGDEIPMMARIVSVADCFDAMTTNRPYQRAMTFEVAIERINSFIGTRYDERVVRALEDAIRTQKIKPDPAINNVPETQAAVQS
ncbi:MAG TPA: HD domain-containing phosphohydrolase [Blastocatellia bacterium]|nr:HD domain-containing phosphohydrolase [Blastocatellia bacterium]